MVYEIEQLKFKHIFDYCPRFVVTVVIALPVFAVFTK